MGMSSIQSIHKWGFTDPWKGSLMMVGWLYFSMPCDDDGTYGMDTVYLDSFPPRFSQSWRDAHVFFWDLLEIARSQWWRSAEAPLVGYVGPTWVMWGSESQRFAAAPRLREEQGRLETYAGVAPSHSSILLLQLRTHRAGALWKESALGFLFFFLAPFFNDFCDQEVSVSISSMALQVSFFQTH